MKKASNIVKSKKQKYAIEMMSGTATVGLMSENDRMQQRHEYETREGNATTTKATTGMNAMNEMKRKATTAIQRLLLPLQRLVPVIKPTDSNVMICIKQFISVFLVVIVPIFILLLMIFLVASLIILLIQRQQQQHLRSNNNTQLHASGKNTVYNSDSDSSSSSNNNVIRIAFIGNSITFVNDLPRLMEAFPSKTTFSTTNNKMIQQNSCLHSSLTFVSILSKGNGMYNKWKTANALIYSSGSSNSDGNGNLYDFGACTVRQLLFGYDKYLSDGNANGHYTDDGTNPCFQNEEVSDGTTGTTTTYYEYLTNRVFADYNPQNNNNSNSSQQRKRIHWDYIVMNDQTVQPGIVWKRKRSIRSLKRVYAKLLNRTKTAIPILLSTYGYDKSLYDEEEEEDETNNDNNDDANDDDSNVADANYKNNNMDDDSYAVVDENGNTYSSNYKKSSSDDAVYSALGDIPEFTSRIWYGYQLYNETLSKLLPPQQQPILVPSALAFLLIYEENYTAWLQLFYNDGFHPSPHGTYLLGCCLYASIYQQMPLPPTASSYHGLFSWFQRWMNQNNYLNDTKPMELLFQNARRMHTESMGEDRPFPTVSEAKYLYHIAERVVLQKYIPKSLLTYDTIAQMEANET